MSATFIGPLYGAGDDDATDIFGAMMFQHSGALGEGRSGGGNVINEDVRDRGIETLAKVFHGKSTFEIGEPFLARQFDLRLGVAVAFEKFGNGGAGFFSYFMG